MPTSSSHTAFRPRAGRLARSPELLAALAGRLTARDRWLLRMLHEHRVLTTSQITQLAFGTTRAATARLLTLHQHQAVDRFRPLIHVGSAPLHFVLGEAGAHVLAAEDALTVGQLGYRRDRALAIALLLSVAEDSDEGRFVRHWGCRCARVITVKVMRVRGRRRRAGAGHADGPPDPLAEFPGGPWVALGGADAHGRGLREVGRAAAGRG